MQAHRIRTTIPESHEIAFRVPSDFPTGEAEVIVLLVEPAQPKSLEMRSFEERFPRNPALGPITFHEDPTAPVDPEDWPEDLRP